MIQNQSDVDIYVAIDGTATLTGSAGVRPGIKLIPGAFLTGMYSTEENAYAIHESTGTKPCIVHFW